jgi:hypothetical protein
MATRQMKLNVSDARDGSGEVVISSGNTLRHRDYWSGKSFRLIPAGIRTEPWKSNPVVLYQHNFGIPVATADVYLSPQGQLKGRNIQFHRKPVPLQNGSTFDTGAVADLWEDRVLNAVSNHIMLNQEDEDSIFETDGEIIIPTSEMLEFSIVVLPADRDAIRNQALALGLEPNVVDIMFTAHKNPESGIITVSSQVTAHSTEDSMPNENEVSLENAQEEETPAAGAIAANVDDQPQEETVETVEVEASVEVEEEELEIPIDDLVNALTASPEVMTALAQALAPAVTQAIAANDSLVEQIAAGLTRTEALTDTLASSAPQDRRLRLVITGANNQASVPAPAPRRIVASAGQQVIEPETDSPPARRKVSLTSMVRTTG